jgi:hypothetical protein
VKATKTKSRLPAKLRVSMSVEFMVKDYACF